MNYSTLSEVSRDLNEWKDEFPYKLVYDFRLEIFMVIFTK